MRGPWAEHVAVERVDLDSDQPAAHGHRGRVHLLLLPADVPWVQRIGLEQGVQRGKPDIAGVRPHPLRSDRQDRALRLLRRDHLDIRPVHHQGRDRRIVPRNARLRGCRWLRRRGERPPAQHDRQQQRCCHAHEDPRGADGASTAPSPADGQAAFKVESLNLRRPGGKSGACGSRNKECSKRPGRNATPSPSSNVASCPSFLSVIGRTNVTSACSKPRPIDMTPDRADRFTHRLR
jgi:hypothetical protein